MLDLLILKFRAHQILTVVIMAMSQRDILFPGFYMIPGRCGPRGAVLHLSQVNALPDSTLSCLFWVVCQYPQ